MPQNETVQKAFYSMRDKIDQAIIRQKGEIVRGTWWLNMPMRLVDQYRATSSYANTLNVVVELGLMKSDVLTTKMFEYFGKIYKRTGVYQFQKKSTDPDLYELFKNIRFPLYKLERRKLKSCMKNWAIGILLT